MKALAIPLGVVALLAYAIVGALLMTDGEVTAASGRSLSQTIADMAAANQGYSVIPGVVFAVAGGLLALAWGAATASRAVALSGWWALAGWSAIVAGGAPAYFFASFGNLNSVGDTYARWNAEAAFALVAPLYLTSAVAAVASVIAVVIGVVRARAAHRV